MATRHGCEVKHTRGQLTIFDGKSLTLGRGVLGRTVTPKG